MVKSIAIALFSVVIAWSVASGLHVVMGGQRPLIIFFAAIMLSAWYGGKVSGLLATALTFLAVGWPFSSLFGHGATLMLDIERPTVFSAVSVTFTFLADARRHTWDQLELKNRQLQEALAEVRTLRGIIPICSYCKKIRDVEGSWTRLETYFQTHTDAEFSHGICDPCSEKVLREMNEWKALRKKETCESS